MPSNEEVASSYGWTLSVINSDPELKRLFNQAKKGDWSSAKFSAELRDTRWYRRHSEQWRRMDVMRHADPAEFHHQLQGMYAKVKDQAKAMGSVVSYKGLRMIAEHSLLFGYSDSEVQDRLARYVKFSHGRMLGQAAVNTQQLRQTALANGYAFNTKWYRDHAQAIARGDRTVEDVQASIRANAAHAFGGFAKELNAGMDLADIASPYVNSMANLWEINPNQITMLDPTIRGALSHRDPKTGASAPLSMTDWENKLRSSHRFLQTQGAQDQVMGAVHAFLQQGGFVAA